MQTLHIPATRTTPEVHFEPTSGQCSITGVSIPEHAQEFYQPIVQWLDIFLSVNRGAVTLRIALTYFNSSSLKALYILLGRVREAQLMGTPVRIIWVVEEDDEFMLESSTYFAELLGVKMDIELTGDGGSGERRAV